MYCSWLRVRLEQISQALHLQVVHSSWVHALPDCAVSGSGAKTATPPSLCGPHPHPHSTRLGEEPVEGNRG